jgi:hypothetical protein
MTTYRDRHHNGNYLGTYETTITNPVEDTPAPIATLEPEPQPRALAALMRKELIVIADQHGIPNYGTRAQLLQRLTDRGITN